MRSLAILTTLLVIAGCGSGGGTTTPPDMTARVDMSVLLSRCGQPGDTGNSIGVGKFCTMISDCTGGGAKTNICSSLGNGPNPSANDTYFCTFYPCHLDGGVAECGEDATCVCETSGCACTPNRCLGNPDAGM